MKKFICMFLVVVMMLSLIACGGKTEPVATTPTVDTVIDAPDTPTTNPTEDSTPPEESTPNETPTEESVSEQLPPVEFEVVDPASLPDPIPVEEQLKSEDTQTVVLGSVEEYEELLWNLGFAEVRLDGTHSPYKGATASCIPVSLTYNRQAFRFDFIYLLEESDGDVIREEGWYMYGTKSNVSANVSPLSATEYYEDKSSDAINLDGVDLGIDENLSGEDALLALLEKIQSSDNVEQMLEDIAQQGSSATTDIVTPDYEERYRTYGSNATRAVFGLKTVYYPVTGNLYNYMRDQNYTDDRNITVEMDQNAQQHEGMLSVGMAASDMCFHYLFPEE